MTAQPTTPSAAPAAAATPVAAPGIPASPLETWEVRVPGMIYLDVLRQNRFGHAIPDVLALGPNRVGQRFQISEDDRRDNQRKTAAVEHDVFKNGMLLRVDADQQADPETASPAVLTDEQILEILDLPEADFKARVVELDELPVRTLRALAEGAGASYEKVNFLDEHIAEKFMPGGPQESLTDDTKSERL